MGAGEPGPVEEWQRLGLDPRQWAYGRWWTPATANDDPQLILPQPPPPSWAEFEEN